MTQDRSRRELLGATGVAAAAAVVGGASGTALASDEKRAKRIVPGSPSPAFSKATVFGGLVFPAGVVGRTPDGVMVTGDFDAQCRQTLINLKASVEAAGATMENVLQCTCFLTDLADFATFNKVFMEFFPKDPPARSTVVVKDMVVQGAKIEIDCVACLPD
ncbi:MAG: RidA family protein [Phycisphaerales bacterium]|nr:RidA family protein [Phycisphaerales bacterium]